MHSGSGFLLRFSKSVSSFSNPRFSTLNGTSHPLLRFLILHGGDYRTESLNWLNYSNSGRRSFCGHAVEQFSDDEYECDFENQKASSSIANIDEWRWKLSLLLRSEQDQEIVSRDKRDRRDYEQISNVAKRMRLYIELYGKVVVASKVPLPNYRPDLDDKRPQREVVIPLGLQRRVEGLLQEHLDRMQLNCGKRENNSAENELVDQIENSNLDENPDSFLNPSVMEKVLQRRSSRMRNLQRAWQYDHRIEVYKGVSEQLQVDIANSKLRE